MRWAGGRPADDRPNMRSPTGAVERARTGRLAGDHALLLPTLATPRNVGCLYSPQRGLPLPRHEMLVPPLSCRHFTEVGCRWSWHRWFQRIIFELRPGSKAPRKACRKALGKALRR